MNIVFSYYLFTCFYETYIKTSFFKQYMPYAKTNRRRYRRSYKRQAKKAYKKGRRSLRGYGTTRTNAINGPLAMRQIVKLRYSEDVNISAGIALGSYDFRANSIFDPNLTGAGHQPLGHDQWAVFYDHYLVLGARIKVTLTQSATGAIDTCFFSLALQDTTNSMANQTQIREQPRSSWTLIQTPYAGNASKTLSKKYSAKQFFGAKSVVTWDKLSAQMGANPTEDAIFRIFFQNMSGTSSISLIANVVIDYIVLLSEPKVINQS